MYNKKQNKSITLKVKEKDILLDFLRKELKSKSRNNIKSALSRGDISVNKKLVKKFDFALKSGDIVTVGENKPAFFSINPIVEILYEDNEIIVISKPHGLLSMATDKERDNTAYHYVTEYVKLKHKNNRVFIVHRLDRDTSGIIMFAKNPQIKSQLQENWNDIVKYRGYTAVVEGKVQEQEKTITSYLKETNTLLVYSSKDKSGDKAITDYKVLSQNDNYSLLDVSIKTGRKNQIRVHLSEMGHPIAGDKKYGAQTNPINRLCLHAGKLIFTHPITKKEFNFSVDIPKAFKRVK